MKRMDKGLGYAGEERFRLPGTVAPKQYRITLEPNLSNFTFIGSAEIDITVRKKTDTVMLNVCEIGIISASVICGDNKVPVRSMRHDVEKMEITLHLGTSLNAGDEATLSFHFSGILNDQLDGFYRSRYTIEDSDEPCFMATTQFEDIGARRAFPCFDEPALKAQFDVTLIVPRELDTVSNMPIKETIDIDDERKRVSFETTPVMSTYLLAFIVGKLEHIEGRTKRGTIVRVITTPGKKEQGHFALDAGIRTLEFYEDYFGIPYPLPKLDMAAAPDFAAGAMENWGLITYRESMFLINPAHSSEARKQVAAIVVAHEIAHQWFGNLVTMDWWNQLWLNEGFASWMEYHAVDALFPEWHIWDQFLGNDYAPALEADSLRTTHAIEVPPGSVESMRQNFDTVSYSKGASVVRMIHSMIGPEAFRTGLKLYLERHAYGNTVTEDLWRALSESSGKPIKEIMDTWTKQPGYPVIDGSSVTYEHNRFLASGEPLTGEEEKQQWHFEIHMQNDKHNPGETAFTRISYAPAQWSRFAQDMQSGVFGTIDRFGLIDDLAALVRAGHARADNLFEMIEANRGERSYLVWGALYSALADVSYVLSLGSEAEQKLNAFARHIIMPTALHIGWERVRGEAHTDTLLRSLVITALGRFGDECTIKEARHRFQAYLADENTLDPNLRAAVYGIIARFGDKDEHAALIDCYRNTGRSEEKQRYLIALGMFPEQTLLEETVLFILSDDVRLQDVPLGFATLAENRHGGRLAWETLVARWPEFERQFGASIMMFSRLVEGVANKLKTFEDAEEVQEFFKHHKVARIDQAIARSIETIRTNAAWILRGREPIMALIADWAKKNV